MLNELSQRGQFLTSTEYEIIKSASASATIRKLDRDDAGFKFRKALMTISILSGIKSELDEPIIAILFQTLQRDYGWLTMEDLTTAFRFNASGKLHERHEHYQELSLTFFTKVLNDYLDLKKSACNRLKALEPPKEPEVSKPEEAYNGLVAYREKNGQFPTFWSYGLVYQHMEEAEFFARNDPRKKTLHKKVLAELKMKQETDLLSCRDLIERRNLEAGFDETVKAECRKRFVQMIIEKGIKGK